MAATLLTLVASGCTIIMQPDDSASTAPSRRPIPFDDPVLNQRRIFLFGDVTKAMAEETVEKLFYLDGQGSKPIDLFIMTPGGDLKAAFSIENAMRLINSPVNTHALAECNSAGAVLLAAGTGERVAFRGAMIVLHGFQARGPRKGKKEFIDGMQDYYTAFWRERARLPADWLPLPQNSLRFLTAEQALEYGLVDRIVAREPTPSEANRAETISPAATPKQP